MSMKHLTALLLAFSAFSAQAAGPEYDFSTFAAPGTSVDLFTDTVSIGPITAQALVSSSVNHGASFGSSDLWARNEPASEVGLGVCSEGHAACVAGAGDINEVSNESTLEGILISKSIANPWSDIFVSSLDNNDGTGNEIGMLWWSDTTSFSNSISFSHNDVNADQGSIWGLLGSNQAAVASAQYLFLTAPSQSVAGSNNDFYVWGVSAIPEPETYAMLVGGLLLMGFVARRRHKGVSLLAA
jgi:hypothetical protein